MKGLQKRKWLLFLAKKIRFIFLKSSKRKKVKIFINLKINIWLDQEKKDDKVRLKVNNFSIDEQSEISSNELL